MKRLQGEDMQTQVMTPQTPDVDGTRPERLRPRYGRLAVMSSAGLLGLIGSSFAASFAFASLTRRDAV
jgi:hypothetical protein